jgi:hypothetical protein
MCARNVTIPVLIQHFSNVTGRWVDLLNRSATCNQIVWKVYKNSTDISHLGVTHDSRGDT